MRPYLPNSVIPNSVIPGAVSASAIWFLWFVATALICATATAQDDAPSPFRSFDDVTVERIRPEETPDYRPGLPQGGSRRDVSDLPRSLGSEQMRRVAEQTRAATVEIIAVHSPPRPYRATKLLYRGHALWISTEADGESPQLVATADWLQDADAVYLLNFESSVELTRSGISAGTANTQVHQPYQQLTEDFLEEHADDLVSLTIQRRNPQLNLAELTLPDSVAPPATGLTLHDMDHAMPATIFGHSPGLGPGLVPVTYQGTDLVESLSFYFLTDFPAILGAPIVSTNGELLAITALRYPENPALSLAIPPGAIHAFLGSGNDDE